MAPGTSLSTRKIEVKLFSNDVEKYWLQMDIELALSNLSGSFVGDHFWKLSVIIFFFFYESETLKEGRERKEGFTLFVQLIISLISLTPYLCKCIRAREPIKSG